MPGPLPSTDQAVPSTHSNLAHLPVFAPAAVCINCGYNLAGLPESGLCPECGLAVAMSLRGDRLSFGDPSYVASLHTGLRSVLWAILATVLLMFMGIVLGFAGIMGGFGAPSKDLTNLLDFAHFAVAAASIWGYWKFTVPDPGKALVEQPRDDRTIIRAMLLAQSGLMLVQLIARSAFPKSITLVFGLAGLGLAVAAAQYWFMMRYTGWIAARVPDAKLVANAKMYRWLLPLLCTVGVVFVGLGPLVALIFYYNLLNRLREHLKAVLAAPAVQPAHAGFSRTSP